ncbi:hypothetical protein QBC34DRAFT_401887 [Podospora aff. communis PSN243]|uniref:Uncharacterized protein n=1 Tax=Podospora aff. communis PSN243 TaxID=3040156 RepID=A0AAV9GT33_9PEZI|nr:hypothetical protein QBC34DRAFT_401887 [Podospora aff. communis PSN243]
MHLPPTTILLIAAFGASAMPSGMENRQTVTRFEGTCDVEENVCIINTPSQLAGLKLNCAFAGGIGGRLTNPPCAEQGHVRNSRIRLR